MTTSNIDPDKIVESLMQTIAQQAQQIAMLQAIVQQAIVPEATEEVAEAVDA
jgi:hypothetical protein